MNIKPFAKIGKEALTRILMAQNEYIEKTEVLDNEFLIDLNNKFNFYCSKCPFASASNKTYCIDHCENFKKYSFSDVEITPAGLIVKSNKSIYLGKTSHRLSRLNVMLFILLHFSITIDSKGIIKNIDIRELSEKLNCDTKSIVNSFNSLVKYGFIWTTKVSTYKYSVKIVPYETYHHTAKEGGNGYLHISDEVLNNLISIKEVNSVRTTISMILEQDEKRLEVIKEQNKSKEINKQTIKDESCKMTLCNIKHRLPRYISNIKVNNIIKQDKLNELFSLEIKENIIHFNINDKYNIDNYKISIREKYITKIKEYLINSQVFSDLVDFDDLLQMSIQYGIDVVLYYLPIAEEKMINNDYIGNCCGFLRNVINKGCLNTIYSKAI